MQVCVFFLLVYAAMGAQMHLQFVLYQFSSRSPNTFSNFNHQHVIALLRELNPNVCVSESYARGLLITSD